MTPEPKGKLDTMATKQAAMSAAVAVVNGPEDEPLDWHAVDWRAVEEDVRRLRQRIFTASQVGDLKRVRSLQKLVLLSSVKAEMADWVQRNAKPWQARPVRRVYIPKKGGRRPLGIPVIVDRVLQARVVNALEPEWEARFESRSYGFRPGRGCHDAIDAIFHVAQGCEPPATVGPRRGSGSGIRPDRPRPPPRHARHVPSQGTDRRLAQGGRGRGRSVHPH